MKDYKMPITNKKQIPNILDHAILLGYYLEPRSEQYLLTAENLMFREHSCIGQCDNRIYDDLHEDYTEISQDDFMKLQPRELAC